MHEAETAKREAEIAMLEAVAKTEREKRKAKIARLRQKLSMKTARLRQP